MTIQLQIDEMLDIVASIDAARGAELARNAEALADEIGSFLANHFGATARPATYQGSAMAGTCVPFDPTYRGQSCPAPFAEYDGGGVEDWDILAGQEGLPPAPTE